jgi:hypothetical protein
LQVSRKDWNLTLMCKLPLTSRIKFFACSPKFSSRMIFSMRTRLPQLTRMGTKVLPNFFWRFRVTWTSSRWYFRICKPQRISSLTVYCKQG